MSTAVNISFIKYNSALGEKLGRGASLFLGALQFLLNSKDHGVEREGRKWIYNTAEQWAKALGYSSRQIERIIVKLQNEGLIAVRKLNKFKANHTNYYSINEEYLNLLLQEIERKEAKTETTSSPSKSIEETEPFDKMSETVRHEGGNMSKKPNKEIIDNKSDEKVSLASNSPVKFLRKKEKINDIPSTIVDAQPPKATTVQDMVEIWNRIHEKAKTDISKSLAPLCVAAFKQKFNSDLKQWEHYCQTIASSEYLTGKYFKLSLYWALKYATIERIQNGEFGVKEIPFYAYTKEQALSHIHQLNEPERCKEIRVKLLKIYGEKAYKDWFSRIHLRVNEGKVCFTAESKFMEDYIRNTFSALINDSIN